ncbi:MAG: hypothetical protein HC810_04980 [Acaryochloridaceae cyanobacterium RL_2_7]|nr:hypothetical protein [Acaryochloridaceae cyanobacterium RL_2_7]
MTDWIAAIADVLVEAGVEQTMAVQRGQDTLITIQVALIVSKSLDDTAIFLRTIEQLPKVLLASRF